jgi:hypothetical protein
MVCQRGPAAGPLEPLATEGVVHQELHHVAGGEELVAHRQLAAVAGAGLALLAHLPALFGGVEVLVDPADGLILAPQGLQVGGVEQVQEREQGGLPGEQQALGGVTVKQGREVQGKLVEDAEQVVAVGVAGLPQGVARHLAVELKALGLVAPGHRLQQQAPGLHHAQGRQSVQYREGLLPHHPSEYPATGLGPVPEHLGGLVVVRRLAQHPGRLQPPVVQVAEPVQARRLPRIRVEPVVLLELAGELLRKQLAGIAHEALQAVAGLLVEGHG